MSQVRMPPRLMVWLGIGFEASFVAVALLLGWLVGQRPFQTVRPDARSLALGVLATLPMLLLFVWCSTSKLAPIVRIRAFFDEVLRPLFASATLVELALVALAAGVGEEALFRGVIQPRLAHWLGPWPGVAIASTLFGVVHAITPFYALLAGVLGVYLGLTAQASGNLLVPIVAHALYDFIALVYLLRTPSAPVPVTPEQPESDAAASSEADDAPPSGPGLG